MSRIIKRTDFEDHTLFCGRNLTAGDANQDRIVLSHDVFEYGLIMDDLAAMIGVIKSMYVSVTERKRESGIHRAIGEKLRTILFQFILKRPLSPLSQDC